MYVMECDLWTVCLRVCEASRWPRTAPRDRLHASASPPLVLCLLTLHSIILPSLPLCAHAVSPLNGFQTFVFRSLLPFSHHWTFICLLLRLFSPLSLFFFPHSHFFIFSLFFSLLLLTPLSYQSLSGHCLVMPVSCVKVCCCVYAYVNLID